MKTVNQYDLINELNTRLGLSLLTNSNSDELVVELATYINHLIRNDFQRLISLLYRVDVNEEKLKTMLRVKVGEDAGKIIATLLIERQALKMLYRSQSGEKRKDNDLEERW